ncbi:MAG: hypothetical protein ACRDTJ_04370 [Pseudonocardiaceae bacterium]
MSDQEVLATAIKAAIQAELPAGVTVYDVDEVPGATGSSDSGPTPARYVTIELSRRWHPERRGDADMIHGGALTTHYRAPNVTLARALRKAVTAGLENRAYDLPDGDTVGPFSHQFDNGFLQAAEGWSAFDLWNF